MIFLTEIIIKMSSNFCLVFILANVPCLSLSMIIIGLEGQLNQITRALMKVIQKDAYFPIC